MNKALFLDRDGVINHDSGYTANTENFKFIDGIFDVCRAARACGYLIIVVTNQAGIGRGYYSEEDFHVLTRWMSNRFEAEGAPLIDVIYCPYHPEHGVGIYKRNSFNRKPNPGMLLIASVKYKLDLMRSIMIGDNISDMQAASNAGVGIRCHYCPNSDCNAKHDIATHCIKHLQEVIPIFTL